MEDPMPTGTGNGPLGRLEEWEDFVAARYAGDQAGARRARLRVPGLRGR